MMYSFWRASDGTSQHAQYHHPFLDQGLQVTHDITHPLDDSWSYMSWMTHGRTRSAVVLTGCNGSPISSSGTYHKLPVLAFH
jgi:hypothetical protein